MLHSFSSNNDGAHPESDLIAVNGVLYGTTTDGGTSSSKCSCGTVFSIDSSGNEKVIYRFTGGKDGAYPEGGLTYANGTFFGTTAGGGGAGLCPGPGNTAGCGTLFAVDASGTERVIHRFQGRPDGSVPVGDLVALNGKLYGVTSGGGTGCSYVGCGTVFTKDSSDHVNVLYSFKSVNDGNNPVVGLSLLHGKLYGTTSTSSRCKKGLDCGTVYTISQSGSETVIHDFTQRQDGAYPNSTLVERNGRLYGTTFYGGNGCVSQGCGTIYSMDLSGADERIVWVFGVDNDGANPAGKLKLDRDALYGVTVHGGDWNCGVQYGCGTVYVYSLLTHVESPLHRFIGGDGAWPTGGISEVGGSLYGTAYQGGHLGAGTVYTILE